MEGVPLYGYDWTGRSGAPIVFEAAMALSAQRGAPVNWNTTSASPWLEYVAQQERHAVWFENAASVDAKLALAGSHPIGGVTLWRLGGEDPAAWLALRSRFKGGAARGNSSVAEITASR
jgi:spore germination protein YaaH